ncbi:MAG: carboxypeptidase-like regulatory domain-containing protein, partial [Fimbriiglobus sp.]|nr:carboxypeptidase-like regulatory domain-containing protein [Fimbriiglobus sp.]
QHEVTEELKADRRPTLFKCDIHPWMQGRLFVFDHPYYTLTDKEGNFELKNVPAGKWRIVYRHETGFHKGAAGRLGFPLEVKGDKKTMELEKVEFAPPAEAK